MDWPHGSTASPSNNDPAAQGKGPAAPKQSLSVANETAVYVVGHIEGYKTDMLQDTGSSVTLVHRRLFNKLGPNLPLEEFREPIISANGDLLDIVGTCKLRLCVGGVDVVHSVLVAGDITQDCLIGVDFLVGNKCKLDFETGTLVAKGRTVVLSSAMDRERPMVCRVSLSETVTVPGEHEMLMQAKLVHSGSAEGVTGVIEASSGFAEKHSMLMARVLAEPTHDNLVPVRVVNTSPTPVTLYNNSHVGTFSEVDRNPLCSGETPSPLCVAEVQRMPENIAFSPWITRICRRAIRPGPLNYLRSSTISSQCPRTTSGGPTGFNTTSTQATLHLSSKLREEYRATRRKKYASTCKR